MYENIEQFYKDNHHILIEDTSEGSLRPAKSVPKDGEDCIEKFKEFRNQSGRMSFLDNELQSILGELKANTRTQNVRIMREMGFITETSNANNQKEYNFTSSFVNFVNSREDTGCFILDRLYAISSLADFTMYLNFLLCVLREATIYGHIIAYPDADDKFRSKVVNAERRKFHRERVYNIYGFQSRGKHWDRDEYTPNVSYYCQAELKKLGLITKKSGEQVDGMDILTLTPSGHYLLKQICDNINNQHKNRNNGNPNDMHEQKIYFGAPGTGKSHKVKEIVAGKESRTERVTFHPEFDYNAFVGGYKPTMGNDDSGKEIIRYEFIPQAFTKIYCDAWNSLASGNNEDFYLIIEEINRGNCAEIFGDIFQLLDRNSDYDITPSKELRDFLLDESKGLQNKEYGLQGGKLKLPTNLNILATMNTSDQSLFPMDSAFKRRWDWEYIPINYSTEVTENKSANYSIVIDSSKKVNWIDFILKINKKIEDNPNLGMDKCIGNYFVKPNDNNEISLENFIHKVIFYLWNDVFKDEPKDSIFNYKNNKISYQSFFPINTEGAKHLKTILENLELLKSTEPANETSTEE
jgi:hypothetical protein